MAKGEYEIDRLSHLQSYGIVHGMSQCLLRPQVPLGGLDRGMAEEKLDLLQLPARLPAQFGAGSTEIVDVSIPIASVTILLCRGWRCVASLLVLNCG